MYQTQSNMTVRRGPVRVMENQLDVPFMTQKDYERLKKKHEDKTVTTDVYGNIVHNYTLQ